jgi:hypothetical protein
MSPHRSGVTEVLRYQSQYALVLFVTMMEYLWNNGQSSLMRQFNISFVRMKMEPLTSPYAT